MAATSARRRYNRSVLLLSAEYAVVLFGAVYFFRHHPGATGVAAYLFAVLPAVPIIMIFVTLGRYLIEERDEYLRMLVVQQTLIATGLTLSIATVWGFLEDFGLAPHVTAYHAAIVWFAGLGVGKLWNIVAEPRTGA